MIKNLIFALLFISFLLIIGLVLVFAYKPPVLWNPLKTFLNHEITYTNVVNQNADNIYEKINSNAKNDKKVTLNNDEFSLIFIDKLKVSNKSFVKINESSFDFYLNIDTNERPLWVVIPIEVTQEKKFRIKALGFGRFNTPQFIANILNDTVGTVFTFMEGLVTSDSYIHGINQLFDTSKVDKELDLADVTLQKDVMQLTYFNKITNKNGY
jgi:hypothetical protein